MGEKEQTEQVPHWVRGFITQRQRQLLEEHQRQRSLQDMRRQTSYNTYLLCPFNQDEVEAVREGLWKLREEAALADGDRIAVFTPLDYVSSHFVPPFSFDFCLW